jgi:hypothetical protein
VQLKIIYFWVRFEFSREIDLSFYPGCPLIEHIQNCTEFEEIRRGLGTSLLESIVHQKLHSNGNREPVGTSVRSPKYNYVVIRLKVR